MTTTDTAKDQAQAQLEHIKELMARLEHARECNGNELTCNSSFYVTKAISDSEVQFLWQHPELDFDEFHDEDSAQQAIDEKPLSVAVRGGWYNVSSPDPEDLKPVEYCILLCAGGPAVRIIGELDNYGQPDTARLEYQDWGTPWTEYRAYPAKAGEIVSRFTLPDLLLSFARCFYYGD